MSYEIFTPGNNEALDSENCETDEIGHAYFDDPARDIDLIPEMTIIAKDKSTNRSAELTLQFLSIEDVNYDNHSISGKAEPGAQVFVSL